MRYQPIVTALLLAACASDDPAPEIVEPPEQSVPIPTAMDIIAGDAQTDTVLQLLPDPLTVAVTDTSGTGALSIMRVQRGSAAPGDPVPGTLVNFVVTDEACGDAFAGSALTDSLGVAADLWQLGTRAGDCTMEVRAVSSAGVAMVFDTFSAVALPGPLAAVTVRDTAVVTGTPLSLLDLVADPVDAHGNARPDFGGLEQLETTIPLDGDSVDTTEPFAGFVLFAQAEDTLHVVNLRAIEDTVWRYDYWCTDPLPQFDVADSTRHYGRIELAHNTWNDGYRNLQGASADTVAEYFGADSVAIRATVENASANQWPDSLRTFGAIDVDMAWDSVGYTTGREGACGNAYGTADTLWLNPAP